MKKLSALIFIFVIKLQISYSQETNLTLTISPEKPTTSDNLIIHCTIKNFTNKTIKIIPYSYNCDNKYYSLYWKIIIQKENINYDFNSDSTIVVLAQPPYSKLVKIKPSSNYNFSFCIDFPKLVIVDSSLRNGAKLESFNDKMNLDFGTYLISLEYNPLLMIRKQTDNLISNKVSITYKQ